MTTIFLLILLITLIGLSALSAGLILGFLAIDLKALLRTAKTHPPDREMQIPKLNYTNSELVSAFILTNALVNATIVVACIAILPGSDMARTVSGIVLAGIIFTLFSQIVPSTYLQFQTLKLSFKYKKYLQYYMRAVNPLTSYLARYLDSAKSRRQAKLYTKTELKQILLSHVATNDKTIQAQERRLLAGSLSFDEKSVIDLTTLRDRVTAVEADKQITTGLLSSLQRTKHNLVPVYEGDIDHVIGVIDMQKLVSKQSSSLSARQAIDYPPVFVKSNQSLRHVLNAFIKTAQHLFMVVDGSSKTVGIITIKDILEALVGQKITDDFSEFDDIKAVAELSLNHKSTDEGDKLENSS